MMSEEEEEERQVRSLKIKPHKYWIFKVSILKIDIWELKKKNLFFKNIT